MRHETLQPSHHVHFIFYTPPKLTKFGGCSARCRKAAPQSESSWCRCACHAPRHFGERAREGASRWQNIWVRGGGKGPMQWELEEAAPLCTEERRCCVSLLWMASDVTRSVARPKRLSERGVVATDRLPSTRAHECTMHLLRDSAP